MRVSPTKTFLAPRSTSTGSDPGLSRGADSSFFTFVVALLILAFASAALILRALILRRRFRSRLQAAIDAGLIPPPPIPDKKPELYETYVRNVENGSTWDGLMPLAVSEVKTEKSPVVKALPTQSRPRFVFYRPGPLVGHRRSSTAPPTPPAPPDTPPANDTDTTPSRVQIAVLIAMPSEYPVIPTMHDLDAKEKRRDSTLAEEAVPDVMFGISTLPVTT